MARSQINVSATPVIGMIRLGLIETSTFSYFRNWIESHGIIMMVYLAKAGVERTADHKKVLDLCNHFYKVEERIDELEKLVYMKWRDEFLGPIKEDPK